MNWKGKNKIFDWSKTKPISVIEKEQKEVELMVKIQNAIWKKIEQCCEQVIEQIEKRPAIESDFENVELVEFEGLEQRYGFNYMKVPLGTIFVRDTGVEFQPNKYFSNAGE
jgi:hypothetical protein